MGSEMCIRDRAGLTVARIDGTSGEEDTLRIRGPRSAEPLARELLARKEDVLTTVSVYNGPARHLDWRRGRTSDKPKPCFLCGRPALCIEPWDGRPCHKSCAEAAIGRGTARGTRTGGGRAA